MKKHIMVFLICLTAVNALQGQTFKRRSSAVPFNERVEYTVSPAGITEQIIEHKGFVVSYNSATLIPNWVAYELTAKEASATDVSRTDEFLPDPEVKGRSATTWDYSGSGYDRGHMAAAADMKWSREAMVESFYLSNTCPQDRQMNAGPWLELEQKCRYWAKKYGSIYIVTGPFFVGDLEAKYIGENHVAVPDAFFKAVLQNRDGRWTGAVFVIPNVQGINDIMGYIYPIVGVEYKTGYKLFANFSPELDRAIKYQVHREDWIIPNWKTQ